MKRWKPEDPHEKRSRESVGGNQQQEEDKHAIEHGCEAEKKPEETDKKPGEDADAGSPASLMLCLHGHSVVRDRESTKDFSIRLLFPCRRNLTISLGPCSRCLDLWQRLSDETLEVGLVHRLEQGLTCGTFRSLDGHHHIVHGEASATAGTRCTECHEHRNRLREALHVYREAYGKLLRIGLQPLGLGA